MLTALPTFALAEHFRPFQLEQSPSLHPSNKKKKKKVTQRFAHYFPLVAGVAVQTSTPR
jgi:hypothetical protein